jgi:glycosyltransferase involved in cell wall biosynthesis
MQPSSLIRRWLLDTVFADAIVDAGYRTAVERYSWERSTAKLENILKLAAGAVQ